MWTDFTNIRMHAKLAMHRASPVASFVSGIMQDLAAVKAALTEPRSNGQTEGQNTKLKLVKRQMYGRVLRDNLDEIHLDCRAGVGPKSTCYARG